MKIAHWQVCLAGAAACSVAFTSSAYGQIMMTFTGQSGGFAYDTPYLENGISAIRRAGQTTPNGFASFNDELFAGDTDPLYFHGTGDYIEFRLVGGMHFNLNGFWIVTNSENRWVETSKSAGPVPVDGPLVWTEMTFSGPIYGDLEWFRIGSHWPATEIDAITVTPVPEPSSVLAGGLVSLGFAIWRRQSRRNSERTIGSGHDNRFC